MKSIYFKILFVCLIVFGGRVSYGQITTTPIQASSLNVINVTQMAKAYFTQDISLGNYSGVDFSDAGLIHLLEEAQKVKDSLDYDVFTVEFPYVSTGANTGLEDNYQLALNDIQSDKYLLFCFVLSTDNTEEMAKFYTAIYDGGSEGARDGESPEIQFLENYINNITQSHFNESGAITSAHDSEAEGLRSFLSSMFGEKVSILMSELKEYLQDDKFVFLTPAGKMISLPSSIKEVSFFTGDEVGSVFYNELDCPNYFNITPYGTLRGFIDENNVFYLAKFSCDGSVFFKGYYQNIAVPGTDYGEFGDMFLEDYTIDNFQNIEKVILGFPCYKDLQTKFKLGLALKEDSFLPESNESPIFGSGYGAVLPFNELIPQNTILQDKKNINATFFPRLSTNGISYLEVFKDDCSCNSSTASYVFAHANQITKYPDFFQNCGANILLSDNLEKETVLNRAEKAYRTKAYASYPIIDNTVSEHLARADYIKNSSVPNYVFIDAELEFWQENQASIYREYESAKADFLSATYWANLDVDNSDAVENCLDRLRTIRKDQCIFNNLTATERLKALKVLVSTDFDDHFTMFYHGVEEPIFIALFEAAPPAEYFNILDWLKGPNGTFDVYFSILNKLNDSNVYDNDTWGYEPFIIKYTQMVQKTNYLNYSSTTAIGGECSEIFNINNNDYCSHLFKKYYDFDNINSFNSREYLNNKIKITTEYNLTDLFNPEPITPLVREYLPDEYMVINLKEDLKIKINAADNIPPQEGESEIILNEGMHVLPAAFVALLIDRFSDASFNFKFRVGGDILIAAIAVTSSSPFIIVAGVTGAVDALLFAPQIENYEIGYELDFWTEEQLNAWNVVYAVVQIPDLFILAGGLVKGINLSKLGTRLNVLKTNLSPTGYRNLLSNVSTALEKTHGKLKIIVDQGATIHQSLKDEFKILLESIRLKQVSLLNEEVKIAFNSQLNAIVKINGTPYVFATGSLNTNGAVFSLTNAIENFSNPEFLSVNTKFLGIAREVEVQLGGATQSKSILLYLDEATGNVHSFTTASPVLEGQLDLFVRILNSIDDPLRNNPNDIISSFSQMRETFGLTALRSESILIKLLTGNKFSRWNSNLSQNVANFMKVADESGNLASILGVVDNFDDVKFGKFVEDIQNQSLVFYTFLGGGVNRVKAWDALFASPEIRVSIDDLLFVNYYFDKHPNITTEFTSNFNAAIDKRHHLDVVFRDEAFNFYQYEAIDFISNQNLNSTNICYGLSAFEPGVPGFLDMFSLMQWLKTETRMTHFWGFDDAGHFLIPEGFLGTLFVDNFNYLSNSVANIHFNLNGISNFPIEDPTNMLIRIKNGYVPPIPGNEAGSYTIWELYQVLKTDLFNKTTFYPHNGLPIKGTEARNYFSQNFQITVYE